jgi:plastocyanin
MKSIFTTKQKFIIPLLLFILSVPAFGQTKHIVVVSNNKFTPKDLTIKVGDTVEWQNTQSSHNVNGTQSTYSSNPESFGNSVGTNWTYPHVFLTPGDYDYRCDPHVAFGMVGTITVEATTDINSNLVISHSKIFPNPAIDIVFVEPKDFTSPTIQFAIYDIIGKLRYSNTYPTNERMEININQLSKGVYFIELRSADKREMLKLIKK